MARYYKAVRPDGTDFRTGRVDYAAALATGEPIRHPDPRPGTRYAMHYLSVATEVTECTGMAWPCRVFVVEPVGETWVPDPDDLPHKVACTSVRVVDEVSAALALGPQADEMTALIERCTQITATDTEKLAATRDAAWAAAWAAARAATRDATRAAGGAAGGLLVRDLIGQHGFTQEHYDLLTGVWRTAIGPIHPDDAEVAS